MKRMLTGLLALCLLWQGIPTAFAAGKEAKSSGVAVSAKSVILVERETGTVLYQQAEHEKLEPASVTKVMTMLLVAEAIDGGQISMDDQVTCSAYAASMGGSQVYLEEGEQMSVHDLLKAVAVASGNDAAVALAEFVSGSESAFVDKMNQRAAELGMKDTHFCNCNGLPAKGHVTSAYDIALMSCQLLKHDLIREVVGTSVYTVPATNLSEPREFYNTNALLSNWHYMGYVYDKAIGVKTGTTPEAGRCLVSAAVDGDEYLIAVILGAEPAVREDGSTDLKQFSESTALLKWGFRNFQRTTISQEDTPVAAVNVTLSQDANQVLVKPVGTLERTLPVDMDLEAIEPTISLFQDTVEAPVKEGQVMGTMTLTYDGEVFGTLDLVATTSVDRSELLYRQEQIRQFFANSGTKLILAAVLVVAVLVLLRLLVFRKRRRYRAGAGAGGRRGSYHGRRRR